ncbi:MAG: CotH kinase family protein [Bacteroidia bacterium]|nr:CotH kinase family protein [Bacteroidia bacterium]
MKKILFLTLLFGSGLLHGQTLFHNEARISEVKLVFEQQNWDHILDSLYVAGDKDRLLAVAWVDGVYYDSIGVRYKGFSSVSVDRHKNPFNIKLDYILDQSHFGVDKIKLGNVIQDPSFVREIVSYKVARNYMPASLANYCNVYINNVFWGVYTSIESVDRSFLAQHFGSSYGSFIKGNPSTVDLNGGNSNLSNSPGTDSADYYDLYELKSDLGWAAFYNLIDKLNNDPSALEDVLNVDRTLWMHALNYTLVNFDSYIGYAQNYYLYEDQNGQFNPILWDMNQSFGSFRLTDASDFYRGFTVEEAKTMDPMAHVNSFSVHPRPLIRNVINTDQRKRMYLAHIRAIVEEHFANGAYKNELEAFQERIKTDVSRDTNKFYSYADFLLNKTSTVQDLVTYPGITDLMDARSEYLLNYKGISPQGAPSISVPAGVKSKNSFQVTTTIDAASDVYLYYRDQSGAIFSRVEMRDDGGSGDNQAKDGVYGAVVPTSGKNIDYYVYADNDSSGTFSPTNAAYNFYEIREVKQLVINEFCASNSSVIADENEDYEDWIELYNNGDTSISLQGYTLSDDLNDLEKWSFSDTSVAPEAYVLIWADDDDEDGPLHTNFKLASGGEAIYLSYQGEVVDAITFGGQTTDVTSGRHPNGTGPFVLMEATPSAFNDGQRISITPLESPTFRVFPNPLSGRFYVESNMSGTAVLMNAQGQTVLTTTINKGVNALDAALLVSGMYFLSIRNETSVASKKIIKQ